MLNIFDLAPDLCSLILDWNRGARYLDSEGWRLESHCLFANSADHRHIAGAADFDGDGQADLIWENTTTGERVIRFLKAGILSGIFSLPTEPTSWHIVNH
jgi:hypothetical protein